MNKRLDEIAARHWYIQKPTAHNCPYRTNGAVFQEFQPTVVDNPGGEWIKVWSSEDLSKHLGMGVTRWLGVKQENANLRAALVHAQCAIKDLGASVNEMYPSDLDGWADVLLAEIEKLERGGV
jgi:hypothetical protein